MDEDMEYDFASFDPETNFSKHSSSSSSDAHSYFRQPSYFSITQLTDLLSTSSKHTSSNSKKSASATFKSQSGTRRSGKDSSAASAPPAPPPVSAATTTSFRSRPASGVPVKYADSDDSVSRLGRNFFMPIAHTRISSATTLSKTSSRESEATMGQSDSAKLASPHNSERAFYVMPNINPSSSRLTQNFSSGNSHPKLKQLRKQQQQQQMDGSPSSKPASQLPGVTTCSPAPHKHRSSAPAKMPPPTEDQPHQREGGRHGRVSHHNNDDVSDGANGAAAGLAQTTTPVSSWCFTGPRKTTDGAAAMQRAVSLDKELGRPTGGPTPKVHFYDLTQSTSPSGASLKGESVVAVGPTMRTAEIQWDDGSDTASSPPALAYVSSPVEAQPAEEYHVQIVIVKADAEAAAPVEVRPPPLDARNTYPSAPLLCPLAPPPPSALESNRAAWHASASFGSTQGDTRDSFTADEMVDVQYTSGSAVQQSLIADSLRIHFLSGHNTMLAIANTPQCTALAEDAVSTMIQAVYRQSELMGSNFRNELSLSAHAVYPDGSVYNLLPTTATPPGRVEMRIGANPIMGTCIVNDGPVSVSSMDEATFLSRGLIQNARHIHADPYADPSALVHVTVLLRQTRTSNRPESERTEAAASTPHSNRVCTPRSSNATGAEVKPSDMHVYLSSLQILWVGHNYPMMHHLLTKQPASTWPLYRQAFGGQCCTAVMSFVDRCDDLTYSKSTLEFSQFMRGFVNRPPRSGSVRKFLISTEQAANEELDRNILSLEKMRRDAMTLLEDPAAQPCMYAVTPRNELPQQPYISAYRVVLIPSKPSTPKEGDSKQNSVCSSNNTSYNRRRQKPSLLHIKDQSTSTVAEVEINMPSFVRRQERMNNGERESTASPLHPISQVQLPSAPPAATASETAPPPTSTTVMGASPSSPSSTADLVSPTALSTHSNDAHVRSDRLRERVPSTDAPNTTIGSVPRNLSSAPANGSNSSNNNNGDNSNTHTHNVSVNDEPASTSSSYGECIKTAILVVPDLLEGHDPAARSSASSSKSNSPSAPERVSTRLPITITDSHTLLLSTLQPQRGGSDRVDVDEVHEAKFNPSTCNYQLLHNFGVLRDLYDAFVKEETNVALLCTHCSATVRPFRHIPVWEVVEGIMTSVSDAQMHLPTPSQFTLFGSILKGSIIVRDLAEVGSQEVDRPVDGQEALVGASPLFGSILYQTRGVDLFNLSEVQPVLHSMLKYADDEAGADPDVYLVMTAVRKTTRALPLSEAPEHLPEYTWDASFSSCTVVVTRNAMDIYRNSVLEMNTVVGPDKPVYPFGLLSEVIGGSCRTVHLLSLETANTTPAMAANTLEIQQMLGQVQNEAQRSNRISVYVSACLTASRAINAVLDSLKDRVAEGDAAARDITPEDESMARAHAAKLEALAEQHAVYLRNSDVRGFVIYPTPTVEDMQTLFFTSFRYSTNSSGRLMQLRATLSSTTSSTNHHHRGTFSSRYSQQEQQQQQQEQQAHSHSPSVSEMVTVDIVDSPAESKTSPQSNGARAKAAAGRPVSAVALSRDSGIVTHTLLLFLQGSHTSAEKAAKASKGGRCRVTQSPTNEVTINYGGTESVYAFDDIINLQMGDGATRVSPTHNYTTFGASPILHDAIAGCLAGYNATVILQETPQAQDKGVCESLCQHVCRSSVASCPPEAAFFISTAYLDEHSAVDLMDKKAVEAAINRPGVEGRSAPLLGKSPLTGTTVANAEFHLVRNSRDVSEVLSSAFVDDAAITKAGAPPHFIVVSLWQKLYVSSEQDVCLSSFLLLITRGGPRVLQTALARTSNSAVSQLLNYALRGPCYSICGCAITDTEPQACASTDVRESDFEPAMDFYQNNLNAYTGKALRYNSVTDALKSHRNEFARVQGIISEYQRQLQRDGAAAPTEQEKRDGEAAKLAMRHLEHMIKDEEDLLRHPKDSLSVVPPFYIVGVKQ